MTDRKHSKDDQSRRPAADAAAEPAQEGQPGLAPDAAEAALEAVEAPEAPTDGGLERVAAERDEYLDHLRRLKAEFENYRKRVQRDNEELRLRAAEAVVESLLPVIDNMGRAIQAAVKHPDSQLLDGVQRVSDQLRGTLAGHGLEALDVEPGALFDPTLHEAILVQQSEEFEEGQVTQVLESGYLLHGRLLRPAKVIVAG